MTATGLPIPTTSSASPPVGVDDREDAYEMYSAVASASSSGSRVPTVSRSQSASKLHHEHEVPDLQYEPPNDDLASADTLPLLEDQLHLNLDGKGEEKALLRRLSAAFFLFGLINNVLYVIILSAALDLVPPSTPKGIIAFCNIAPSLTAKVGWPYLLKGTIRYTRRLLGCCLLSVSGMLVIAAFDGLYMRLLGIGLASFSSGLGEMTFLQLSTTYHPPVVAGRGVSYFASGTGAAGLVGAFLWWELRGLGVRFGVGLSSFMPFVIPLTYFFLLPSSASFLYSDTPSLYETASPSGDMSTLPYTPLAAAEDEAGEEEGSLRAGVKRKVALSAADKWRLVQPMLRKYMLPLFLVYTLEYTINQGIAPTLLYPVPSPQKYWLLSKIIHSIRDYYPLWQVSGYPISELFSF
ncbi:hypothetical protein HGRIS_012500 [Hohenbuehelia grisea]|uniref:Protein BTN n=1 Tax=Hohenbuehelia grisea TaxID=104357 RepID=A0ABR3ISI0_9AGAR